MHSCEIIFVKQDGGWKWRPVDDNNEPLGDASPETYQLFYECVVAARSRGYRPNVRCL
jgi:hypothetical protein